MAGTITPQTVVITVVMPAVTPVGTVGVGLMVVAAVGIDCPGKT